VPKILVAAYGGGHARLLAPVVRMLNARGYETTVLGLTLGRSVFEQEGITAYMLSDILQQSDRWPEIVRFGEQLVHAEDVHPEVGLLDSVVYMGSGFLDLAEQYGPSAAMERYQALGRKAFDPVTTAREILELTACDLLVTTNAPRMERALVRASGLLEKKSVVVVDSFATIEREWLAETGYSDRVCVFHQAVKQCLIDDGRSSSDVVVTGNPAFDSLTNIVLEPNRPDTPHVVYLSQNEARVDNSSTHVDPDFLPCQIIETLAAGVRSKKLTAEVRFHPNQSSTIRDAALGLVDRSLSCSLGETLADADVVVTASSTAGVQAQLLGLPLVQIAWSIRSGLVPFNMLGPVWFAHSTDELLDQMIAAAAAGRFPRDDNLGQATQAVIDVIEGVL
jgi:hypothetical protein